ncbi:MAG: PqqD family protein [Bacilli bacterium]|nr:PqqD family protein [Acholeplasmataceae bacterium]MDY2902837.1 PqqD family protein [Bacilli bacterium]
MKIKSGFMLRMVADNYIVVPVGEASKQFNGMITLNETSAFLWNFLMKGTTEEKLVDELMKTYDVSREIAIKDVKSFIYELEKINVLDE